MHRLLPALLLFGCATTPPPPPAAEPDAGPQSGPADAGAPVESAHETPLGPGPVAEPNCERSFCGCWTPLTLSVSGTAVDAESGRPLPAAVATDDGRALGRADADGRFAVRYETKWSPGCKLQGSALIFTAPGYATAQEPLPPAGPSRTELRLEAGLFPESPGAPAPGDEGTCGWGPRHPGRLELEVVDAAGKPVEGAAAFGTRSDKAGRIAVVTEVRGSARCGTGPHRAQAERLRPDGRTLRGSAPLQWRPASGDAYEARARLVLQ